MGRRAHTDAERRRGQALGRLLTTARSDLRLSQQDAAQRAGLALSTIRKLENGSTPNPGFYTLVAYANVLGIDLGQVENPGGVASDA
jgi:transcriptional regulator with XRE-family HTH domain